MKSTGPRCVLAVLLVTVACGCSTDAGQSAVAQLPVAVAAPPANVLDLDRDRPRTVGLDSTLLVEAIARADTLPRLRCLLVARNGEIRVQHCRRGFRPGGYANVKSVSKAVLSALVGIAIAEGRLKGTAQKVAELLPSYFDSTSDPVKRQITVGDLLSMQSGLERTSGRNYGAWVSSKNWVRDALRRPMVANPGGRMLYSTGNYHLLSAILTRVTGESTLAYAREKLGRPLDIHIPAWLRDPQGIYLGGNDMRLSPRAMVRFGELYRNGGAYHGEQVVPEAWVRKSLEPRTTSPWSGQAYGYGWFLTDERGYPTFYAWGYGGQFIFVVPDLALTVVTTSDPTVGRDRGHLQAIHSLLADEIIPAAERGG